MRLENKPVRRENTGIKRQWEKMSGHVSDIKPLCVTASPESFIKTELRLEEPL